MTGTRFFRKKVFNVKLSDTVNKGYKKCQPEQKLQKLNTCPPAGSGQTTRGGDKMHITVKNIKHNG